MSLRGIVTKARAQGPRKEQQDRFIELYCSLDERQGHLIGVADGHGGAEVAEQCAKQAVRIFKPWTNNAVSALQEVFAALHARTMMMEAGSTLSLAWINEWSSSVVIAVLGDSPIIVVDAGGHVHLSDEHNAQSNIAERKAVERRGGVYAGGYIHNAPGNDYGLPSYHGLQVTRALGDSTFRYLLDREPKITSHPLSKNSAVVVGSDGLFEGPVDRGIHYIEAEDIAKIASSRGDAATILSHRQKAPLDDNTSVIMWRPRRWWEWF